MCLCALSAGTPILGNDKPMCLILMSKDQFGLCCRLVNIHVINTLGVAPADVPQCIECWCPEEDQQHALKGRHGGGDCCSDSLCPSSEPSSNVNTYHLQFNVTYRYNYAS